MSLYRSGGASETSEVRLSYVYDVVVETEGFDIEIIIRELRYVHIHY